MDTEGAVRRPRGLRQVIALFLSVLFPLFSWAEGGSAGELTVAKYLDVTLARLEFQREIWATENRAPSMQEEELICAQYGVTQPEYLAFNGKNRVAVERYLRENPTLSERIDSLGREVDGYIHRSGDTAGRSQ
ncbi:hypothetical protein MRY87_13675 [bacterium]|nr:hypothetical protein [bacterium]